MDNVQSDKTDNTSQQTTPEAMPATGIEPEGADKQKPGAILAARRKAEGIAEEQIASRLKMTLRQLRALEADDYDALHGIAISRGFVRAYARVLKIDPEPLVAMFGESNPYATLPGKSVSTRGGAGEPFVQNQVSFRKKGNLTGKIVIVLIVIVIAVIVAWNMKRFSSDQQAAKVDKQPVASTTASSSAQVTQPEKQEQKAPENAQAVQEKEPDGQSANIEGGNDKTAAPAAAVVQPTESKNNQTQPAMVPVKAASSQNAASQLNMNFSEKSWVRVQGNDGTVLAEYMGLPGEQRSLDVNGPVTVIVGYAPGVRMTFRGAPVDLESHAVNSVARISLK